MTNVSREMVFWAAQDSMAIEWSVVPMKATGADAGDDDDDSDDDDDGDNSDAAGEVDNGDAGGEGDASVSFLNS